MKMNYECLPCLVNQVVKVANITKADNQEELFRKIFAYLSNADFSKSNPEISGAAFRLLKQHIQKDDPYREIRAYYNRLFLHMADQLAERIDNSPNPLECALRYAIIGNVIDFNPIHSITEAEIMKWLAGAEKLSLAIDHTPELIAGLASAGTLLYLGDNCGEICLDKLLIQKIKALNPRIHIFFGVRGTPVVNDSVEADACFVGINEYADIISNGDDSLGTVLDRTSGAFRQIYEAADVVISKGQGNYESLSGQAAKKIYFLLVAKCETIAKEIGVTQKSIVCMSNAICSQRQS